MGHGSVQKTPLVRLFDDIKEIDESPLSIKKTDVQSTVIRHREIPSPLTKQFITDLWIDHRSFLVASNMRSRPVFMV